MKRTSILREHFFYISPLALLEVFIFFSSPLYYFVKQFLLPVFCYDRDSFCSFIVVPNYLPRCQNIRASFHLMRKIKKNSVEYISASRRMIFFPAQSTSIVLYAIKSAHPDINITTVIFSDFILRKTDISRGTS